MSIQRLQQQIHHAKNAGEKTGPNNGPVFHAFVKDYLLVSDSNSAISFSSAASKFALLSSISAVTLA